MSLAISIKLIFLYPFIVFFIFVIRDHLIVQACYTWKFLTRSWLLLARRLLAWRLLVWRLLAWRLLAWRLLALRLLAGSFLDLILFFQFFDDTSGSCDLFVLFLFVFVFPRLVIRKHIIAISMRYFTLISHVVIWNSFIILSNGLLLGCNSSFCKTSSVLRSFCDCVYVGSFRFTIYLRGLNCCIISSLLLFLIIIEQGCLATCSMSYRLGGLGSSEAHFFVNII